MIFFVLSILTIIAISVYINKNKLSFSEQDLADCDVLQRNSEGIDIVIFADKRYIAEDYMNYFLITSPFNRYSDKLNFYYIGDYYPLCELYKDIALFCYSKELVKKAGSCPNDYVIVINNDESEEIRSSSYLNVMSLNTKHPKSVLIHEFGHSFVNLAEEYVPAKIPRNSGGNCVEDCKDFNGKNEGCFLGCSLAEYSRSIENGVMRTLRSDKYGNFNEWVITNKIDNLIGKKSNAAITGAAFYEEIDCASQDYYLVEVGRANGNVDIEGKEIEKGCFGDSGSGEFSAGFVLEDGSEIKVGNFNPDSIFTDIHVEGDEEISGETFDNSATVFTDVPTGEERDKIEGDIYEKGVVNSYLKVPIIKDAKSIEIENKKGETVASLDLCEDLLGDVDGNGKVDSFDLAYMDRHLDGIKEIICEDNADFNRDGRFDRKDSKALSNYLLGPAKPRGSSIPSERQSPSSTIRPSSSASPSSDSSPSSSSIPSSSASPSASPLDFSGNSKNIFQRITGFITGWFSKIFD